VALTLSIVNKVQAAWCDNVTHNQGPIVNEPALVFEVKILKRNEVLLSSSHLLLSLPKEVSLLNLTHTVWPL